MAVFTGIPAIPTNGLQDWQVLLFSAVKENIELLTGERGGGGLAAVLGSNIRVEPVPEQSMKAATAKGNGYTISGKPVADVHEFGKLIVDVNKLAYDLAKTNQALNTLIQQLKQ